MKPVHAIADYHAHVYYDKESKAAAQTLRSELERQFPGARYGRWHDRPVGPHPDWSYQIAFAPDLFDTLMPFLALNRGQLVVFTHPNTDDGLADHRDHAIWMGAIRPLDLSVMTSDRG